MKLISIVLAALLIGLVLKQQLGSNPDTTADQSLTETGAVTTPKVPTQPEGVQQFSKNMDKFMMDQQEKRQADLD